MRAFLTVTLLAFAEPAPRLFGWRHDSALLNMEPWALAIRTRLENDEQWTADDVELVLNHLDEEPAERGMLAHIMVSYAGTAMKGDDINGLELVYEPPLHAAQGTRDIQAPPRSCCV